MLASPFHIMYSNSLSQTLRGDYCTCAMTLTFIIVASILCTAHCYDSESLEYNGIEISPLYETIIYSDIADILNEIENSNVPVEKALNESESDENLEDLLSEYQQYLDKAHKQRINYIEKTQLKNKVPMIRHEKFTKTQPAQGEKHKNTYKNPYITPEHKFSRSFKNPLDILIPFSPKKYFKGGEQTTHSTSDNNEITFQKMIMNEENGALMQLSKHKSCYCKERTLPCKCDCKQCLIPLDHIPQRTNPNIIQRSGEEISYVGNNPSFMGSEDNLNIRIKVDVQLPNNQEHMRQFYNNQNREKNTVLESGISKEYPMTFELPSPYFNFPIPMNLFGYQRSSKSYKNDLSPIHKITVHKKKKTKVSNGNKKHHKKVITFHNIKIEPQLFSTNFKDYIREANFTENKNHIVFQNNSSIGVNLNATKNTLKVIEGANETQTEENVLLLVNISNTIENVTNDIHKAVSSNEPDYVNRIRIVTTDAPIHLMKKREISALMKSNDTLNLNKPLHHTIINSTDKRDKDKTSFKKIDKTLPCDMELLYWPNVNSSAESSNSSNITTIILENENKKTKLNMSVETLRNNRTSALEQAIFGNVQWDDVDAIVPAFISFVGKYIDGILTLCSERICHSMNCGKKICLHRICAPIHRFNNKGHCIGSNSTDSIATMESIMDLPSNIVFEIVDILQDRMLGKLYGKSTLCISFKCITFAVSKKIFIKSKCTVKELNPNGHCTSSKKNNNTKL